MDFRYPKPDDTLFIQLNHRSLNCRTNFICQICNPNRNKKIFKPSNLPHFLQTSNLTGSAFKFWVCICCFFNYDALATSKMNYKLTINLNYYRQFYRKLQVLKIITCHRKMCNLFIDTRYGYTANLIKVLASQAVRQLLCPHLRYKCKETLSIKLSSILILLLLVHHKNNYLRSGTRRNNSNKCFLHQKTIRIPVWTKLLFEFMTTLCFDNCLFSPLSHHSLVGEII